MRDFARLVVSVSVATLAIVLLPRSAGAQSYVEGELNRGKAALQLKNYDEAAMRFGKLARAGNPAAQFYMGRLTAMGLGVEKWTGTPRPGRPAEHSAPNGGQNRPWDSIS